MWPEEVEAMRHERDALFRESGVPGPEHPDCEGMVVGESPPPWRDEDAPPDPDAFLKQLLWQHRESLPWPR